MPVAAPLIGGGALLASTLIGSKAAGNAANAQTNAANQANQTLRDQYAQTRQDLSPYNAAGNDALKALESYYGIGGAQRPDYQKLLSSLPGYQFQMQSGTQAVDQNLAARGLLKSGAAGKALTQYGQGLGQQYGNQYAAGLMGLVGQGENAASQTGYIGANAANNIGANQTYAGNAQGQGYIGQANAWQSGLQGVAGLSGLYMGQQRQQQQQPSTTDPSYFNDPNPWPAVFMNATRNPGP